MKIFSLGIFVLLSLLSCKTQSVVPEQFYFKTVTVNGSQSGGFYANNLNLTPKVDIAFSAPLNKESAQTQALFYKKKTHQPMFLLTLLLAKTTVS